MLYCILLYHIKRYYTGYKFTLNSRSCIIKVIGFTLMNFQVDLKW